jgi:hypothetical protein
MDFAARFGVVPPASAGLIADYFGMLVNDGLMDQFHQTSMGS